MLAEMTPSVRGVTPGRRSAAATPLRDQFGLNSGFNTAMVLSEPRADKLRQKQNALAMSQKFKSLPVPEDKFDIVAPEVVSEPVQADMEIEEDESDKTERR